MENNDQASNLGVTPFSIKPNPTAWRNSSVFLAEKHQWSLKVMQALLKKTAIQDSRHRSGLKHTSPYYSRQKEYPKSKSNAISCHFWKTYVSNSIPELYSIPPVLGPQFMNRSR